MKEHRQNSAPQDRFRVVNIVTSSLTVQFLEGQPEYLKQKNFEIVVVSSPGKELTKARRRGVQTVAVPIAREISLCKDLSSLWRLHRAIFWVRPIITNVATPKAGLLGGIAAWMCRVPCRYYTLLGLRCETATGLKRCILLLSERIACRCADRVICVSESLRQKAIELGIVCSNRTVVLASGAYTGVNPSRYAPTQDILRRARQIREELHIAGEAPVIGFVGRLTKDKGITELIEAYLTLRTDFPHLKLLLVGDIEEGDPLPPETRRHIKSDTGIIHVGFLQDPAPYYHVMDVLAFPTHREGFGNVALEAQASGKPVVAARATGVVDSVIDGVTGILVPIGDASALAQALKLVLTDRNLAATLGIAGRERVIREFRQDIVWDALAREYMQFLSTKGLVKASNQTRTFLAEDPSGSALSL